ncbi:MAG: hypothetical protein JO002_16845 [Burkholderiaceae bacterium]|nr:hypothetical protein [Burkholderiaceae bacterium]
MKKLLVLLLVASLSQLASAATAEEDVAHYVEALNGPKPVRIKALDDLAWKGISDPRVFDPIEKAVLAELDPGASGGDRELVQQEIRALSFSGQSKYLDTLQKAAADMHYSRYGKTALNELYSYARWNPIISNRATWDPKNSDDDNRLLNMLHSSDLVLKRVAGKRVYFENKDPVVLEAVAADIKAEFRNKHSGDEADGLAWLVKGLGSSGDVQYRPLMEEVVAGAPDHEAVSHAKRVLDKYMPKS